VDAHWAIFAHVKPVRWHRTVDFGGCYG
jgi:hypothetical protein